MATQDLGPPSAYDGDPEGETRGALDSLFDSSPASEVRTSAAAGTSFVLGLFAALAVPFSLAMTLCVVMGGLALVSSVVGMARASKPGYTGGLLAPIGLLLALVTLTLVALRYLGIDTAFGDGLVPSLLSGLETSNGLLPAP